MYSLKPDQRIADAHIGHDSAFVSTRSVSGELGAGRRAVQMDNSAHAAKISVAVMLRAAKTAVQALIADISPWILRCMISVWTKPLKARVLRWVASAEVCASAYYLVGSVVHDDGSIGSERTGTALLEESLVCLLMF
jgi:hypothetical protein